MVPERGIALGDFVLRGGRVYLRQTGNSAAINRHLLAEVAIWVSYHIIVLARAALGRVTRRQRLSIWFTPQVAHPRYMVRSAAIWAGIGLARSAEQANAIFFFEDATRSERPNWRAFNSGCTDISKSRVAAMFEQVFGYPLAVDPRTWTGDAVEKSEENGAHDGRIVACPCAPQAGKVYQRLIDTVDTDGFATDLRTHVVNSEIVASWVKKRAANDRFLPPNLSATLQNPSDLFTASEIALIARFAAAMGADWCGLDILRDRDGRIYIVDLNKTDAGPIIALPMRQKLASTAILADALLAMIGPDLRFRNGAVLA